MTLGEEQEVRREKQEKGGGQGGSIAPWSSQSLGGESFEGQTPLSQG